MLILLLFTIIHFRFGFGFDYEKHVTDVHKVLESDNFASGWCNCWNNTKFEIECHCHGKNFSKVPDNLNEDMEMLSISDAGIKVLEKDSFVKYRNSLKDM